jgi:hypothetical protein
MANKMKLLVLEFNELCTPIIEDLMARGELPNFRRLRDRSAVFSTDAQESPPNLEPWIQWPTVHSGLSFQQHGVFNLGDGDNLGLPSLAEALSKSGVRVGVFGSMNVNYSELNGYFLPDPWHRRQRATPDFLQPYYKTIASQVQESSKASIGFGDLWRLGWFLVRNGLSFGTARRAMAQLIGELRDPGIKWRRASVLDDIQYDVFRSLNDRMDIEFATFFCNSTAHYQHYYWRNMAPEQFEMPPPREDHPSYREAIPHGYRSMDRLIGRALDDYPDATIVLCTALSQKPWTDTVKCTFRPRDFNRFLSFAGVDPRRVTVKPVMAEQFHLDFDSEEDCRKAREALADLTLGGEPLMLLNQETPRQLFSGCLVTDARKADAAIVRKSTGESVPFREHFYMIHTVRSGHHDPRGTLWIGTGQHCVGNRVIPLQDIAPTILEFFRVPIPEHMKGSPLPLRQ